jgi:hypothetical protein
MSAGIYNLYIERGATLTRNCIYQDGTGTPINLSGMSLLAQVRANYSEQSVIATITTTITNAASGQFTLSMTSAETEALPVNMAVDFENQKTYYTWDLLLDTGTTRRRLMQGNVTISPDVSRD